MYFLKSVRLYTYKFPMIIVKSKRSKNENIFKKYSDAEVADVTSKVQNRLVKMSPFSRMETTLERLVRLVC